MAAVIQRLQDKFLSCIICTDLFKDPCTLSCGHTFCRGCLTEFTETQPDAINAKSLLCPSCKQMTRVPNPNKNVKDWVKQFKLSFMVQGLLNDFAFREIVDMAAASVGNPCFACLQHDETTPASTYCADCEVLFCSKCVKAHRALPSSASHTLSDLVAEVKVMQKRKVICKAHNSIVEFCCKDCHKAVCQRCCILDHRKCDNVVTIDSMMPEMKSVIKQNRDMLSQQVEWTESNMEIMKITEMEGKKAEHLVEIHEVSQNAINMIRLREKQMIDELEDITGKQVGELRGQLKSGEIDIQMYQQHREFIEKTLTAESKMDMYDMYQMCQSGYITAVSVTDTYLKYTSDIDEIMVVKRFDQQTFDSYLHFGILQDLKNKFDPKCTPTLVDTIDITAKSDKSHSDPVDVTVLVVDGKQTLLVTDHNSKCLKSFYTKFQQPCHSSLPLSSEPWSVTRLTHNKVVVSYIYHNQITLVKVIPELVLLSNMITQKKYRCLTALTATAIVAGCRGPPSLDILDLTGHVQRSIMTERRLIQGPGFLSTTNKGNILVSDRWTKSVVCLTAEGDIIFNYSPSEDRELGGPLGVTTSVTGDILVADCYNSKVIQLTPTGDFVRDLLTSQDGIGRPLGIVLHKNKLYVVQEAKPINVFRV